MPLGASASAISPAPRPLAVSSSAGVVGVPEIASAAADRTEPSASGSSTAGETGPPTAGGSATSEGSAAPSASESPSNITASTPPSAVASDELSPRATVLGSADTGSSASLVVVRPASGRVPAVAAASSATAYALSAASVGIALDALSDSVSGDMTGRGRSSMSSPAAPQRAVAAPAGSLGVGGCGRVVSSATSPQGDSTAQDPGLASKTEPAAASSTSSVSAAIASHAELTCRAATSASHGSPPSVVVSSPGA